MPAFAHGAANFYFSPVASPFELQQDKSTKELNNLSFFAPPVAYVNYGLVLPTNELRVASRLDDLDFLAYVQTLAVMFYTNQAYLYNAFLGKLDNVASTFKEYKLTFTPFYTFEQYLKEYQANCQKADNFRKETTVLPNFATACLFTNYILEMAKTPVWKDLDYLAFYSGHNAYEAKKALGLSMLIKSRNDFYVHQYQWSKAASDPRVNLEQIALETRQKYKYFGRVINVDRVNVSYYAWQNAAESGYFSDLLDSLRWKITLLNSAISNFFLIDYDAPTHPTVASAPTPLSADLPDVKPEVKVVDKPEDAQVDKPVTQAVEPAQTQPAPNQAEDKPADKLDKQIDESSKKANQ